MPPTIGRNCLPVLYSWYFWMATCCLFPMAMGAYRRARPLPCKRRCVRWWGTSVAMGRRCCPSGKQSDGLRALLQPPLEEDGDSEAKVRVRREKEGRCAAEKEKTKSGGKCSLEAIRRRKEECRPKGKRRRSMKNQKTRRRSKRQTAPALLPNPATPTTRPCPPPPPCPPPQPCPTTQPCPPTTKPCPPAQPCPTTRHCPPPPSCFAVWD